MKKARNTDLEELVFSFPTRLERLWEDVKIPAYWSLAAIAALGILVSFSVTRKGGERLAMLPYEMQDILEKGQPGTSLNAALEQHLGHLREENVQLTVARTKLEARVAQLEESMGDITASIPKRETVPAQSATAVPPAEAKTALASTIPVAAETGGGVTMTSRSQFGIDLGTEQTMGALRIRWVKLMEQFGMIMAGYEPIISVRDADSAVALHLVVGPFSNAAEAAEICAKLRAAGLGACAPAPYDGQRLALSR